MQRNSMLSEGHGVARGQGHALAAAGEEKPARGALLHFECAESGNPHFAILVQTVANGAKHCVKCQLGCHGRGGSAQMLAHEFL